MGNNRGDSSTNLCRDHWCNSSLAVHDTWPNEVRPGAGPGHTRLTAGPPGNRNTEADRSRRYTPSTITRGLRSCASGALREYSAHRRDAPEPFRFLREVLIPPASIASKAQAAWKASPQTMQELPNSSGQGWWEAPKCPISQVRWAVTTKGGRVIVETETADIAWK